MGKALTLRIPEQDASEDLIEEYGRRLAAAQNEHLDAERSFDELVEYKHAMEKLRDREAPVVHETVMSAPIRGMGRERFDKIFELENGDFQRTVLDEDGIKELREALEDAVPRLNEMEPDGNWEATLARHITMCEFALDHGLKIELNY